MLIGSGDKGRTGVLTDSYRWMVFHLDGEFGLYSGVFDAEGEKGQINVLGII